MNTIEVRGFGDLRIIFDDRNWPFPYKIELSEPTTCRELAQRLELPIDKIEATFVNGNAQPMDSTIMPGDRVGFIPQGIPGPYRVMLGFVEVK